MSATAFYLATIIVYGAVDSMACLGLNVQFGFAGLSNFGFIIFQAAGAYVAAILSMGNWHKSNGGFQHQEHVKAFGADVAHHSGNVF